MSHSESRTNLSRRHALLPWQCRLRTGSATSRFTLQIHVSGGQKRRVSVAPRTVLACCLPSKRRRYGVLRFICMRKRLLRISSPQTCYNAQQWTPPCLNGGSKVSVLQGADTVRYSAPGETRSQQVLGPASLLQLFSMFWLSLWVQSLAMPSNSLTSQASPVAVFRSRQPSRRLSTRRTSTA